jgi:hypothetical protein
VFGEDGGCERGDCAVVDDVEDGVVDGYVGVGAVLRDEFLEVLFAATGDNYACAGFDELGEFVSMIRYMYVVCLMWPHTFAARAQPIPLVAPRTRTFLYWRDDIFVIEISLKARRFKGLYECNSIGGRTPFETYNRPEVVSLSDPRGRDHDVISS